MRLRLAPKGFTWVGQGLLLNQALWVCITPRGLVGAILLPHRVVGRAVEMSAVVTQTSECRKNAISKDIAFLRHYQYVCQIRVHWANGAQIIFI